MGYFIILLSVLSTLGFVVGIYAVWKSGVKEQNRVTGGKGIAIGGVIAIVFGVFLLVASTHEMRNLHDRIDEAATDTTTSQNQQIKNETE